MRMFRTVLARQNVLVITTLRTRNQVHGLETGLKSRQGNSSCCGLFSPAAPLPVWARLGLRISVVLSMKRVRLRSSRWGDGFDFCVVRDHRTSCSSPDWGELAACPGGLHCCARNPGYYCLEVGSTSVSRTGVAHVPDLFKCPVNGQIATLQFGQLTMIAFVSSPRRTENVVLPGLSCRRARRRLSVVLIFFPLIVVMISPAWSPPFPAGRPLSTSMTIARPVVTQR